MKLFESTPVHIAAGTFRLELKGSDVFHVFAASRACCEILNWEASQLEVLSAQFMSLIHPDDRSSLDLALEHAF